MSNFEEYPLDANDVYVNGDPNLRYPQPPPSGGTDLDSLDLSTNESSDDDLFVTKEDGGTAWVKKSFLKIWNYIKSKIQSSSNEVAYGTCSTAAATAAKVATLDTASNWKLKKGTIVCIKFTNTNTAQNPTLNVNNSGAKSVYYNTGLITTGSLWTVGEANRFTSFMYDGTNWVWMGSSVDRNTTYSNMTTAELLTGTATTQRTMRADYTRPAIEALSTGYGTCDTAAGAAAKVVTMADSNWKLRVGAIINVKFTNTNTFNAASGSPVTLNVNDTGAKNIYYGGSNNPTGTNTTAFGRANYINSYVYDGTNWVWCGSSTDNNTTYTGASLKTNAAKTGSGTTVTSTIAANTTMDNAIGTLLNNDVALNSSLEDCLEERVVNGSKQTATTGASGNISVGISSSYIVLAVEAEGYYAYPFKNNGSWYIKICNYETLAPIARTSVTYRIAYKKIV